MTPHQLQELLESEQARPFIEQGEERGHIEPVELEAFAVEHDLGEDEIEQLTRELEAIGLEVREARAETEKAAVDRSRSSPTPRRSSAPPTACSSSSPTSGATSS